MKSTSDTNEETGATAQQRLVMPRRKTKRWLKLAHHLDAIHAATDDAIHKGFVKANKRKLDKSLADIEAAVTAARAILRHNASVEVAPTKDRE